jgi:hypothetical protein
MKLAALSNRTKHPPIPPESDDCFRIDGDGKWIWRATPDDYWTLLSLAALVEHDHIAHKAFARWIQTSDAYYLQKNPRSGDAARRCAYEWLRWAE